MLRRALKRIQSQKLQIMLKEQHAEQHNWARAAAGCKPVSQALYNQLLQALYWKYALSGPANLQGIAKCQSYHPCDGSQLVAIQLLQI